MKARMHVSIRPADRAIAAAATVAVLAWLPAANSGAQTASRFVPGFPDLAITNLTLNAACQPVVTITNKGGALPPEAFKSSAVQFTDGSGRGLGGYSLTAVDPTQKLRNSGGTVSFANSNKIQGVLEVKVAISLGSLIDANIANNQLKKSLGCGVKVPANPSQPPDLTVTDLTVDGTCRVVATIKNNGPGSLPPLSAYSPTGGVTLQFASGGKGVGGYSLAMIDPNQKLMDAGGSIAYTGTFKVDGNVSVSVSIDAASKVAETNESNNQMTKTFTCTPPPSPTIDLAVTDLTLNAACQPVATITNRGGALPPDAFQPSGPGLQFTDGSGNGLGGYSLAAVDPTQKLKSSGGTLTFANSNKIQGILEVKAAVSSGSFKDTNPANNELKKPLGCEIRTPANPNQPPDLTVTDLTVDGTCRVVATIKNNGPGSLPPLTAYSPTGGVTLQFASGGKGVGGYSLAMIDPNQKLMDAGGSIAYTGTFKVDGNVSVSVSIDAASKVAETNESNNQMTKTLSCSPPK